MIPLVLRSNAILSAALGVFLLAATWNALYEAVDVTHPDPAVFAQIGGAFALALAYLLWIAPRDAHVTQAVAAGGAIANGFAALLGGAWLAHDRFDAPASAGLVALVVIAAVYALSEGWIVSRSVTRA